MRESSERLVFFAGKALGRVLRSTKYASVRLECRDGTPEVRKRRAFYAPALIWMGGALLTLLDSGVRILPAREWRERERRIYGGLYSMSIRVGDDGALMLPYLPGATLAAVLDDSARDESVRKRAVELAAVALAAFHRHGWTHGDAMAENVLVDLDAGIARWFDFETVHDARRVEAWRRADDVRALLATCLLRTPRARRGEILERILDVYADEEIAGHLRASFASAFRRPLVFHLAQAPVSFECFRGIAALLTTRRDGLGQPVRG